MNNSNDPDAKILIGASLSAMTDTWRKRAMDYGHRAETETDPLNKESFRASAMAYSACVFEASDLLLAAFSSDPGFLRQFARDTLSPKKE